MQGEPNGGLVLHLISETIDLQTSRGLEKWRKIEKEKFLMLMLIFFRVGIFKWM